MGFGGNVQRVESKGAIGTDNDTVLSAFIFGRSGSSRFGFSAVGVGGSPRRYRGLGIRLTLLLAKLQSLLLEGFEGLLTLFWGVDSEDHP